MALLESLRAEQIVLPVIMITGHDDIDMAVQAMQKMKARSVVDLVMLSVALKQAWPGRS